MNAKKAAKLDMDDRAKILQYFSRPVGAAGDIAGRPCFIKYVFEFKFRDTLTEIVLLWPKCKTFQVRYKVLRLRRCLENVGAFQELPLHSRQSSRFKLQPE